jgi:hypothetical protein
MQTLKCFRVLSLAALIFLLCGEVLLAQSGNLYNQLVEAAKSEVAKKGGKLTIAPNWTIPDYDFTGRCAWRRNDKSATSSSVTRRGLSFTVPTTFDM